MPLASINKLLKENEAELLRERRSSDRKPFVRPVTIVEHRKNTEAEHGFSRDLSSIGIGLIGRRQWSPGTTALLTIHRPNRRPVEVTAEVRWCESFGNGWFQAGWRFIREGR